MLSSRSRPGSSSTRRMRPRGASGSCLNTLLWICTIFAFPDGSLDVRDRIELLLCLLKLPREPRVLGERLLKTPRVLVVARLPLGLRFLAEPTRLGVENQPLLDLLQMDRDQHPLRRKERRPCREQAAEALLRLGQVLVRMPRRRHRERKLHAILRRRRRGGRLGDFPERLRLREQVAFDE